MEKEGSVTLWLGNIKSEKILDEYLQVDYDNDDGDIFSAFLKDFNIDSDDFDEDFLEYVYYKEPLSSISKLLEDFSYDDDIIPKFTKILLENNLKYNAVILLYNFQYTNGIKQEVKEENYEFRLIGSVTYDNE